MLNGFRGRKNQVRNPQFIGFLQESGFRRGHPDRYEISLRRRRAILNLVILLLLTGFVWVMIESAHALSLFGN